MREAFLCRIHTETLSLVVSEYGSNDFSKAKRKTERKKYVRWPIKVNYVVAAAITFLFLSSFW